MRAELNARVDAYFESTGRERSGGAGQALKILTILAWFVVSYGVLLFVAATWWQVLIAATSLALAMTGIGFAVMHDGGHGASFKSRRWNKAAAMCLDLVGGSSYVWNFKHNILHHQFPNVVGVDDDIEANPFLRMAPSQARYPWHRFQFLYVWLAYAFLPPKWHWFDDYKNVVSGRIGDVPMPRPKGWDLFGLLFFKAVMITWAVVIPLVLHPVWIVALVYAYVMIVSGNVLSTTFQLAHCLDAAEMCDTPESGARLPQSWAEHQLATTANFCPNNRLLSWYVGGLNYQVEHHLFPKISHRHYPALAKIVQEVCAENGIRYRSHSTLWAALASHVRWLRAMGKPVAPAEPIPAVVAATA